MLLFHQKHQLKLKRTLALAELGTVRPGDAALEAQLLAHHLRQVEIHLVVAHRSPGAVVVNLQTALVGETSANTRQTNLHLLGRQWSRVEEDLEEEEEEERGQETETQHPIDKKIKTIKKNDKREAEAARHAMSCVMLDKYVKLESETQMQTTKIQISRESIPKSDSTCNYNLLHLV